MNRDLEIVLAKDYWFLYKADRGFVLDCAMRNVSNSPDRAQWLVVACLSATIVVCLALAFVFGGGLVIRAVAAGVALYVYWSGWRKKRIVREWLCVECGYPLGEVPAPRDMGRCPECGTSFHRAFYDARLREELRERLRTHGFVDGTSSESRRGRHESHHGPWT